jgi:hypothetical protein
MQGWTAWSKNKKVQTPLYRLTITSAAATITTEKD